MFIASSTIICLHYATNYENLWPYRIGVAQTQIQPSPLTHKAPSRPQSYSHLLHILAHQCLLFLTLIASVCFVMQILLPSLSLNNFLLFSYTLSAPIVHRHTSRYTKISPLTPSSPRTISKIIIFYSRSISCCHTCFAYHTHLTKIITFFWYARTITTSWYYIFAPICRTKSHYSQIFIMNIIIFRSWALAKKPYT